MTAVERALGWLRCGDMGKAREVLEARVEEAPEDGLAVLELGVIVKLQGEIEPAFALLRRGLELLPEEAVEARQRGWFVLGLTYGDVKDPVEAVRCFEEVVRLDAGSTEGEAAAGYAEGYREHYGLT